MRGLVTYWTGIWDPGREAVSGQVEALRRGGRRGIVVSYSRGQGSKLLFKEGVVRLSRRQYPSLRALAMLLEPLGRVTHVVGGLGDWHLLRSLGRRPVLLTVAVPGGIEPSDFVGKVSLFAAESETLRDDLVTIGVPPDRIRIVYPGIDLARFSPSPLPAAGPFRLLFASTPSNVRELQVRGIPLLAELARAVPDVEIVVLWRRWGNEQAAREALGRLSPPRNFEIVFRDAADMAAEYRRCHAVACCYAAGFGKSCPNSIVEALACGRPALVTSTVGISGLIGRASAGVVTERTLDELVGGLAELRRRNEELSRNARALAVSQFDVNVFRARYQALYEELAGCCQPSAFSCQLAATVLDDAAARPSPHLTAHAGS
ncbi:MAG: glycosyltransferase family 4 protein [Acidobacteria bacterium]|nr:glycosyltransferase family 4 protein [Acidobacteriota bacterium]